MTKQSKSRKPNSRYQKHRLAIEQEQYALMLALREAQEEIRNLGHDSDADEEEVMLTEEREALAVKCDYYRRKLKSVKDSLSRLRSGKFGICESCGDEISEKRLTALPTAHFCLECQQSYEHERADAVLLRA